MITGLAPLSEARRTVSCAAFPNFVAGSVRGCLAVVPGRADTAGMQKNMSKNAHLTTTDDFFVPELCQPEALLGLVLLAELLVLVLVLAPPMQPGFDWVRLALTSLIVQWVMLLSVCLTCRLRPLLARLSPWLAGLACCALVVGLTLGCTAVADIYQLGGPLSREGEVNLYLRHALIGLIMSGLLLRYFYLQSQWRRQEQAELRARIESLQARLRSSFLLTCLKRMASLVATDEPAPGAAVLDVSALFGARRAGPAPLVPGCGELDMARRYLSIERYRLGVRLQV